MENFKAQASKLGAYAFFRVLWKESVLRGDVGIPKGDVFKARPDKSCEIIATEVGLVDIIEGVVLCFGYSRVAETALRAEEIYAVYLTHLTYLFDSLVVLLCS